MNLKKINKNKILKYLDKGVSFVFIFSVFILSLLYVYYRGIIFPFLLMGAVVLLSACLLVFFLYFIKYKKIIYNLKKINLSFFVLFLLFFGTIFIFANLFLVVFGYFDFQNFFKIEYSILQKVLSVLLFYFVYFLLNISLGERILDIFKLREKDKRDRIIFSYGIGFFVFSLTFFLIAVLGLLYQKIVFLLVLASVILSFKYFKNNFLAFFYYRFKMNLKDKKNIIFIFVFLLLSAHFVSISKPNPITTDDLHTYWNAPLEYVRTHSYLPMANTRGSSATQDIEMTYAGIMSLLGTKYIIHFQFFSFCFFLFVVYRLTELYFDKKTASLAVLSSVLIPWNFYYIETVKVEMSLLLFSVITILALYKFFLSKKQVYLILFACFSGVLFGIKYFGIFLILLLFFFLFIFLLRNYKIKQAAKQFFLAGFIFIIVFSPWMIKNYYYFKEPLYPLQILKKDLAYPFVLTNVLEYRKGRSQEIDSLRHFSGRDTNYFSKFVHQTTGEGIDKFLWINYGLACPLFLIFFLLLAKKNKKLQYLNVLLLLYFLIFNYQGGARPWYGMFAYVVVSFLLLYYLFRLKYAKYFYLLFLLGLVFAYSEIAQYDVLYLSGQVSANEYKERVLPFLKTGEYINKNKILEKTKILLIGDTAVATIEGNGQFMISDPYLSRISYSLNQGNYFFENDLKNNGFGYLIYSDIIDKRIVFWPKNNKGISLDEYLQNYSAKTPSIYQDILKLKSFLNNKAKLVFDDGYYKLYKIKE